jgi:replicative DNA helicase
MQNTHPDYEGALIGALLLYGRDAVKTVAEFLQPHHFRRTADREVYKAIREIYVGSVEPVNSVAVASYMRKNDTLKHTSEADILAYTIDKTGLMPAEYAVGPLGMMVAENGVRALLFDLVLSVRSQCEDMTQDVFDIITHARQKIDEISTVTKKNPVIPATEGLHEVMEHVEAMARGDRKAWGVSTGWKGLDRYLYGLEGKNLYVVAGRPSHGKTAFAMQMASAVMTEAPVGVFSMEQSLSELIMRMLSQKSGEKYQLIKTGRLQGDSLEYVMATGAKLGSSMSQRLFVADSAGLTTSEIRIYTMMAKEKWGIKGIIIDYLQLVNMDERGLNRDQQIGKATRALKSLAKELDIFVVLLSQLSRAVEQRTDRRPQLSDLRESGNIEQDADTVIFVWRPYLQGVKELDFYGEHIDDTKDHAMVMIAKQRNGELGDLLFKFDGPRVMFSERDFIPNPTLMLMGPQSREVAQENDDEPF